MIEGQEVKETQDVENTSEETAIPETKEASPADGVTAIEVREEGTSPEENASDETTSRIADLEAQSKDFQNKFLRARADLENFRKRTEREKQDAVKFANRMIFNDILNVLDNFERAVGSATDPQDPFVIGVVMIQRQLLDVLLQNGVEEIEAMNRTFDPYLHEALAYEPTADHPENTIIEIFQKGYRYKGQLLRAAKVKVSAAPVVAEPEPERDETTDEADPT